MDRQKFTAVLKDVWLKWAQTHPTTEAFALSAHDNCIADPEVLFRYLNTRRIQLAEKKSVGLLTPEETSEFEVLQEGVFDAIDVMHPPQQPAKVPEHLLNLLNQEETPP